MNIENETLIMENYNITPNELHCVKIILLAAEENDNGQLARFCSISPEHKECFRNCLQSLQTKGIILKSYKIPTPGSVFIPRDVEFNKNFLKKFYRSSFEMGKELFETYPMFGEVNGVRVSLRGVARKFDSLEDFYSFYGKTINYNPELHDKIISLVNWAKENTSFINQSICSFVIDNGWIVLENLKNNGNTITDNIRVL